MNSTTIKVLTPINSDPLKSKTTLDPTIWSKDKSLNKQKKKKKKKKKKT